MGETGRAPWAWPGQSGDKIWKTRCIGGLLWLTTVVLLVCLRVGEGDKIGVLLVAQSSDEECAKDGTEEQR
jgi:hypothetical protein